MQLCCINPEGLQAYSSVDLCIHTDNKLLLSGSCLMSYGWLIYSTEIVFDWSF
jgi:hypothetical protein